MYPRYREAGVGIGRERRLGGKLDGIVIETSAAGALPAPKSDELAEGCNVCGRGVLDWYLEQTPGGCRRGAQRNTFAQKVFMSSQD